MLNFKISKFQNSKFQNFKIQICKFSNYTARLPFWSTKKHDVATKLISYERYGEILFQKVASGYLLHFAQDGSSKNALKNSVCATFIKIQNFRKLGGNIRIYSPLTPDQPPFKGGYLCYMEYIQLLRQSRHRALARLFVVVDFLER